MENAQSNFGFKFDNTYQRELDGLYIDWQESWRNAAGEPLIVQLNDRLAGDLGLDVEFLKSPQGKELLVGREFPKEAAPLAQAYAGHQFGGFVPSLGDGRALLIGELIDQNKHRRDIYSKGSGRTPFSRGGDGKAAIGPVLREYLVSEAMHALGVPTTRALAAVTTGEKIMRNGFEPGAVLTRIAASHIRVGTFQYFAARRENGKVKRLADYAIKRHFPELEESENKYLGLLSAVIDRQTALVAKWVSIGFVHGVMNTDNTTISGETIDYGPCAFMDAYDPAACYSSIDRYARYSYANQPHVLVWNLSRFAETLIPLIDEEDQGKSFRAAGDEVSKIPAQYNVYWLAEMRAKLGLSNAQDGDRVLVENLLKTIDGQNIDFTQLFRNLADAARGNANKLNAMFADTAQIESWLATWFTRLKSDKADLQQVASNMDKINPLYIPRNHLVEEALVVATNDLDFEPFHKLLEVLTNPFDKRDDWQKYDGPAPKTFGEYTTYCGT